MYVFYTSAKQILEDFFKYLVLKSFGYLADFINLQHFHIELAIICIQEFSTDIQLIFWKNLHALFVYIPYS